MATERRRSPRPIREDLVRALVLEAYGSIRSGGWLADRALNQLLRRERRLWAAERREVAESVYGLLRSERRLDHVLRATLGQRYEALGPSARHTLLLEAWRAWRHGGDAKAALLASGLSLSLLPGVLACAQEELPAAILPADPAERLGIIHSLPTWIARIFVEEVGEEEAGQLAATTEERAPLTIRTNTLRGSREALIERLAAEGVAATPTPHSPLGLTADGRQNLFGLEAFKQGAFEVQDEGSQLLSLLLSPSPGDRVIDTCAGSGGKTLALAAMMENRGRIVALDSSERRLAQLGPRARRADIHNWESHVVPERGSAPIEEKWQGRADGVLVDAPCTGLGVLRRNPDARFRLQPEDVASFAEIQGTILRRYAALVKEGGRLVYGTCSVATEENEAVIERFLRENPSFELLSPAATLGEPLAASLGADEFLRLFPHRHGTDGFFGALLGRKDEPRSA